MKCAKKRLEPLAALFVLICVSEAVYAFHSGGVGECTGCHSMHSAAPASSHLLKNSDPSSTCLNCHMDLRDAGPTSYHVATSDSAMPPGVPPLQRSPGGDFSWLKKNYSYSLNGTLTNEDGSTHGHNIVAIDYGFVQDPVNLTAPGGSFPSQQLGCTSCHDPHGKYRRISTGEIVTTGAPTIDSGSYNTSPVPVAGQAVGVYRLLAGAGYTQAGASFSGVPAAVAPEISNRSESATQTRVAYGNAITTGHVSWSQWCGACHPGMHSNGEQFAHPADQSLSSLAQNYATYVKTGDMTGSLATSYLSLVPFVENTSDYTVLASHATSDNSFLIGPSSSDMVSCLSCHRAHASGWADSMRWNMKSDFLTYNGVWPGTDLTPGVPQYAPGRTSAETQAAYYDRPASLFAVSQRVLCNKCHAQD